MKEICRKCNGKFIESDIEYLQRFQNDSYPICLECIRKANVKKSNKKLEDDNALPQREQIKKLKRKHGLLSVAFLMRKFKVTVAEAEKMMLL